MRFLILWLVLLLPVFQVPAQTASPSGERLSSGFKGQYETAEAAIKKVYAAESDGHRFRAYVVDWKGQEVVVTDPLGLSEKGEGEMITFMVQSIEAPVGSKQMKLLQFLIMDLTAVEKAFPKPEPLGASSFCRRLRRPG